MDNSLNTRSLRFCSKRNRGRLECDSLWAQFLVGTSKQF